MIGKKIYLLAFAGSALFFAACNTEVKKSPVSAPAAPKTPAIMEPFKFHKLVEVVPGEDYDVMSWGRGAGDKNSLLILHSDSSAKEYTTTTGDLDGPIVDVYNSDMDVDGNPEIIIQTKTPDTNKFVNILVYEFNGSKANKLDFPRLTVSQRKGYRGGDNLYISQGKLMRQFPVYDGDTKEAKPTGEKRLLEYSMHGNQLSAQTMSNDSTAMSEKAVAPEPKKKKDNSGDNQSSSGSSKKKKHHEEDQPKKKKRRHHHSD